jgi:hypothetical protein
MTLIDALSLLFLGDRNIDYFSAINMSYGYPGHDCDGDEIRCRKQVCEHTHYYIELHS